LANVYRGDWVVRTDGNNNKTATHIDNLNRANFITDRDAALVGTTRDLRACDSISRHLEPGGITDIVGNNITRTFDRLGRLIYEHDPDRGRRSYRYNALGDLVGETKGAGQVLTYEYDAVGRLTRLQDSVDGDVIYTWDAAANGIGKLAQIDVPLSAVTTKFEYDGIGRQSAKNWKIGSDSFSTKASFDAVGRVARITYPKVATFKPFAVRYEYGNFGQLLRAVDDASGKVYWRLVSSDASGRFSFERLGNGLLDMVLEDPARPSVLKSIRTMDSDEALVRDIDYTFDLELNVLTRHDKIVKTNEKFEYDSFNRLHSWRWKGAVGTRHVRWDYDDIGNMQMRKIVAGPGADLAYTYNPAVAGPHAVVSTTLGAYQYDTKGNQIAAPGRTVVYGRNDLPTRVTRTSRGHESIDITYDGETSRVRAVDERTGFTTDSLDHVYLYRRAIGKKAPRGEHVFVIRVPGRAVALRVWVFTGKKRTGNRVHYVHADHQRSIELTTGATGDIIDRLKYEPFGRRVKIVDPAKSQHLMKNDFKEGYTGHEHVEAWDLIDMKGRVYDPGLGMFLSADPFVSNPLNPQAWNRYSYVLNNPVTLRDPTGFDDDDVEDDSKDTGGAKGSSATDTVPVSGSKTTISFATGSTVIGEVHGEVNAGFPNHLHLGTPALAPPSITPFLRSGPETVSPPPRNDDGQGGAAASGLPMHAGVAPGDRGRGNAQQRDPAEKFLNHDRDLARRYQATVPFGHPGRYLHKSVSTPWTVPDDRKVESYIKEALKASGGNAKSAMDLVSTRRREKENWYDANLAAADEYLTGRAMGEAPWIPWFMTAFAIGAYEGLKSIGITYRESEAPNSPATWKQVDWAFRGLTDGIFNFYRPY
jgi:RHS repeat-associated protein